MKEHCADFDRLAVAYEWFERLAFGSDLEAARFCLLAHLQDCQRVLVLGEGDGRFLMQLLRRFPHVRADCIDASAAMIARASSRLTAEERARVTFLQMDARRADFGTDIYDAVVTLFFLDCFTSEEASELIVRVRKALRVDACWLWADFAMPTHGWSRLRAVLWLRVLYSAFGRQTGLTVRQLPPAEELLQKAGFVLRAEKSRQAGLLRSAVWIRQNPDHACI